MSESTTSNRRRNSKYQRAKIRHFLFTVGPNRLSGGRLNRRHIAQDVTVRELEVASPSWPKMFDGLRIGHVSDFHLGELLPLERALQIVEQLRAQEPDLIACTGDVVDLHHDQAAPLLEAMVDVNAPLGAAMVLGNHDELHCAETISKLATEAGVTVLRNDVAEIHNNGRRLRVAGIDWAKSAMACAKQVDRTCAGAVDLLLAHNPKAFLRAAEVGIPLTLAGHTHGGQISLRHRSNTSLALSQRPKAGLYSHGQSRLYVTAGVGAWFPLRINCPAEIAMITMRHAEQTPEAEPMRPKRRLRRRRKQHDG